jgi:hypothetical protein
VQPDYVQPDYVQPEYVQVSDRGRCCVPDLITPLFSGGAAGYVQPDYIQPDYVQPCEKSHQHAYH